MTQLFVAGIPAVGKSRLGDWLEERGSHFHIDAELNKGSDFDQLGVHADWDTIFQVANAQRFRERLDTLSKPVVITWGFGVSFLPAVSALAKAGIALWWLDGDIAAARRAFIKRGGIPVECFDIQVGDIKREWQSIARVFEGHIINVLHRDGSAIMPPEIWAQIERAA